MRPYLAAAAHVVVMPADGSRFAPEHVDVEDRTEPTGVRIAGPALGPELDVHVHHDDPDTYKLWGQVRLADGTVITKPFTVKAP